MSLLKLLSLTGLYVHTHHSYWISFRLLWVVCSDIPLLVASTRFKDWSDPDTSQSHRDEIQLLFQQSTTIAFSNEEVIGVSSEQFWNEIPDLEILKERPFIVRIGESWVAPAWLEIGVTPKRMKTWPRRIDFQTFWSFKPGCYSYLKQCSHLYLPPRPFPSDEDGEKRSGTSTSLSRIPGVSPGHGSDELQWVMVYMRNLHQVKVRWCLPLLFDSAEYAALAWHCETPGMKREMTSVPSRVVYHRKIDGCLALNRLAAVLSAMHQTETEGWEVLYAHLLGWISIHPSGQNQDRTHADPGAQN